MELARLLDPEREPGRLTLIHRFGHQKIAEGLPPLIEAVRKRGPDGAVGLRPDARQHRDARPRASRRAASSTSCRSWSRRSRSTQKAGSYLGGVHFELTGEDVTECIGGARGLVEEDLQRAYRTQVDPRLNYEQALEMALLIARRMGG